MIELIGEKEEGRIEINTRQKFMLANYKALAEKAGLSDNDAMGELDGFFTEAARENTRRLEYITGLGSLFFAAYATIALAVRIVLPPTHLETQVVSVLGIAVGYAVSGAALKLALDAARQENEIVENRENDKISPEELTAITKRASKKLDKKYGIKYVLS